MEIIYTYKDTLPSLRMIGKRYSNNDRGPLGGFGMKWIEWYDKQYYKPLNDLGFLPESEGSHYGCVRYTREFEYWISLFFPLGTPVPDGYMFVDLPPMEIGVCSLYGNFDNCELFGEMAFNLCRDNILNQGWHLSENPWFIQRYNFPIPNQPDESGNVIFNSFLTLAN